MYFRNRAMRNYNYVEKSIKLEDKKVKAYFPKTHSTVKGIIYSYDEWDQNAGDDWANIRSMKAYIRLYILWKKHKTWQKIVDGDKNTSDYHLKFYDNGTYYPCDVDDVLFQFETKDIQRKFTLQAQKRELKDQIKTYQKRLKRVEMDLKELRVL